MRAETLLERIGADFYTGVPDSLLKALCGCLLDRYGTDPRHHVIGANEGTCAALAAGYHLATGRTPVVYLQNSGEGNLINPAASLLSREVYGIPVLFIVGWRGEPGVRDEPQHVYQGKVTLRLLEDMEIASFVLGPETTTEELEEALAQFRALFAQGRSAALVVRSGALTYAGWSVRGNGAPMGREEVLHRVLAFSGEDPVVCTTGKASRELFECRAAAGQGHARDFLTVGSMGHSSSIALGIALQKPDRRVWCLDGDGALLMHMGAMAIIGASGPKNLIHVVVNNGAHESVGGMPTAAGGVDLPALARACGYLHAARAERLPELDRALTEALNQEGPQFLEVRCGLGARVDLGRPTLTPEENKRRFMAFLE